MSPRVAEDMRVEGNDPRLGAASFQHRIYPIGRQGRAAAATHPEPRRVRVRLPAGSTGPRAARPPSIPDGMDQPWAPALHLNEVGGRCRLSLVGDTCGDGDTLQEAADDLVARLLNLVMCSHQRAEFLDRVPTESALAPVPLVLGGDRQARRRYPRASLRPPGMGGIE
jgi:hypothetical protein